MPDGTRAYITDVVSNAVFVVDTDANAVIATIPVGANPIGIAIGTVCEPGAAPVWETSTSDFFAGTFEVYNASVTDNIRFAVLSSIAGRTITVTVPPQTSVSRMVLYPQALLITSLGNHPIGSHWCITLYKRLVRQFS